MSRDSGSGKIQIIKEKEIGKMNGLWGVLFRLFLMCFPFLVLLEIWQVVHIFGLEKAQATHLASDWTKEEQKKCLVVHANFDKRLTLLEQKP